MHRSFYFTCIFLVFFFIKESAADEYQKFKDLLDNDQHQDAIRLVEGLNDIYPYNSAGLVKYSIDKDCLDCLKVILEKTSNYDSIVRSQNSGRVTCLIYSIIYSKTNIAKYLISKGADIHISQPYSGEPALYTALRNRFFRYSQRLIDHGAKITDFNQLSRLLSSAASDDNLKMLQITLSSHEGIDQITSRIGSRTPIDYAVENENYEIIKLLKEHYDRAKTPFHRTVQDKIVEKQLHKGKYEMYHFLMKAETNYLRYMTRSDSINEFFESGNDKAVELLIDSGYPVNNFDKNGTTLLQRAISYDKYEIVKKLVRKGADVNLKNNNGMTPLQTACYAGNERIVNFLLKNNVDTAEEYNNGLTELMIFTAKKDLKNLIKLTEKRSFKKKNMINEYDQKLMTAVHICSINGDTEIFDHLLTNGAKHDKVDLNDNTPLHYASRNGNVHIVEKIIKLPHVLNKNKSGFTPFQLAVDNGHNKIADLFLKKQPKKDLIKAALKSISNNNISLFKMIVPEYIPVNSYLINSDTFIFYAIDSKKTNFIMYLIENGADLNKTDSSGRSPLAACIHNDLYDIMAIIRDSGVDIDTKDNYGYTPIMHLIRTYIYRWETEISKELIIDFISRGADYNATLTVQDEMGDEYETTLRKAAASQGDRDILKAIKEAESK